MITLHCRFLLVAFSLFLACPTPLYAQERIQDEAARSDFIYRVNLGRADDVRLMIRQGASANQVSGVGVPVLSLAAARTDEESVNVMKALLHNGANINARDRKGQTALFHAAKTGNIAGIKFLLDQGIDLYAIDNSGNVARSVAHLNGQDKSIKAIDNYVLKQTAEVTESYRENKRLKKERERKRIERVYAAVDNYETTGDRHQLPEIDDKYSEERKKQMDMFKSIKKTEVLSTAIPTANEAADKEPVSQLPNMKVQPVVKKGAQANSNELPLTQKELLKDTIYEMAYNVCAFQYWYYCSSARQSTDIDEEELIVAIDSRKNNAEKLQQELVSEYNMKSAQVSKIAKTVQKRIYTQLNNMASNRDRHEKGVGKLDDMRKRCELLARHWGAQLPVHRKRQRKKSDKRRRRGGNSMQGIGIDDNSPEPILQRVNNTKPKKRRGRRHRKRR